MGATRATLAIAAAVAAALLWGCTAIPSSQVGPGPKGVAVGDVVDRGRVYAVTLEDGCWIGWVAAGGLAAVAVGLGVAAWRAHAREGGRKVGGTGAETLGP